MFRSQKSKKNGALERLRGVVIIEDVQKLHASLKVPDQAADDLVRILDDFDRMHISRAILVDIKGLGKDVKRLKKHEDERVSGRARNLVRKWKKIIRESVEREQRRRKIFGDATKSKRRRTPFASSSVIRRVRSRK